MTAGEMRYFSITHYELSYGKLFGKNRDMLNPLIWYGSLKENIQLAVCTWARPGRWQKRGTNATPPHPKTPTRRSLGRLPQSRGNARFGQ